MSSILSSYLQCTGEAFFNDSCHGNFFTGSVSTLNLTVFQVTGHVAFLKWDRYEMGDKRAIISYVIKYKEA